MSSCCSKDNAANKFPRRQSCPINQQNYILVSLKTILHNIKAPWKVNLKEQGYYFCNDPECDVVYFGENGQIIKKQELLTTTSVKQNKEDDLVCYCFNVKRSDAQKNPQIKTFVIEQTKIGNCSCETSNPSGRCCLKYFPKQT